MIVGAGASLNYTSTGTINASSLEGSTQTWEAPGTIGSTTPNTGAFTTLTASSTASVSGTLTVGNGTINTIRSAFGPLTLAYKSGPNAWTTGITLSDITGYVGIGTTPSVALDVGSGYVRAQRFEDTAGAPSYYLDPGSASTSLSIHGNIVGDGAFSINSGGSNGAVTIDAGSADVYIGAGGGGKLNATTIDPAYTIDGGKFATYVPSMVGIKEEATGTISTSEFVQGQGYKTSLDFTEAPSGSDLWLFSNVTNLSQNLDKLVVLLSPAADTKAWYTLDPTGKINIYTGVPTSVSYRLTAPRFDSSSWSNDRTDYSTGLVTPGNTWPTNGTPLGTPAINFDDLVVAVSTESGETYSLVDSVTNQVVEEVSGLSKAIIANIKAGFIETQGIATNSFTAFQGTVDNLLVKSGLVAMNIQTKLISPLPDGTDVTIQIGSEATPSGQFVIQNASGSAVTTIDNLGNATFSGQLTANGASVSGTLYADNIQSQSLDDIQALLTKVETDQNTLKNTVDWSALSATNSASLDQIAVSNLYVTNQAAISSLSVTNSLTFGSDMVIGSDNTINTLTAPLKIQSLAMAPIEMMNGLVTIDTKGNVNIAGDLNVAGRIRSSGLTLKDGQQSASPSALLSLQDASGNIVSSVDASGSALFNNLTTGGLTIASDSLATASAVVNGVITTNATAGQGIIPAGVSEITIKNPKVTDYTLVYVTPTSTTENYVLYVKSKEVGQFTVGFTDLLPIPADVSFNWWIVQVSQ